MSDIVNVGLHLALVIWVIALLRKLAHVEKLFARLNARHDELDARIDQHSFLRQNVEQRVWDLEHRPNLGPYR